MNSEKTSFLENVAINAKLMLLRREIRKNEEIIGVKPAIQNYGRFLKGYEKSSLSKNWQRENIPIRGNNYWTIGPAESTTGGSLRFNPNSDLYQAWFGIYTHIGIDRKQFGIERNGNPDIDVLKRLAEVDQKCWLDAYGDDEPMANLTTFKSHGKIKVDGINAFLYYGEIDSHSDVGMRGRGYEGYHSIARSMNFSEKTDPRLFIPNPTLWSKEVSPHHSINLKGLFTVIHLGEAVICIYLNGAEYKDNNQKQHDTWNGTLKYDAMDMIQSVKIGHVWG